MPEMGGIEATMIIRQMQPIDRPPPAIIALTANVLETNKQQCADAGMDAVLCKPIQRAKLKETIEAFLGKNSNQQSS